MSKWIRSIGDAGWRMPLAVAAACFLTAIAVHKSSAIATPTELRPAVAEVEHSLLSAVLESATKQATAAATDSDVDEVCSMAEPVDHVPGG
jgi:hypothetical protein